jgi:hypothetical protein
MIRQRLASAVGVLMIASVGIPALAQTARSAPARAMHTPWGEPDLTGMWTNETITPFERPANLAGKAFLTEEEAKAIEARAATQREASDDRAPRAGDVGNYNQFWMDSGTKLVASRRTALVIDPPDGRVPLRQDAEQRRDGYAAQENDDYNVISPWDRCITRGIPGGFFPAGYNNAYQIVQTPGYVIIHYEMIHMARIIPTNGRPHLPSSVRLWDGDSVGRWEGETLVVDITNYNGKGWIATNASSGRIKGIPQSDALHVVERFTRSGEHTIDYQVTIDDPKVYTRPWTAQIPLNRDDGYQMYEYACHEGNHAIEHMLRGGRARDREAAAAETKPR